MIENYSFGSIIIGGQRYDYDVEIRWTGEVLKWWRGESHFIDIEDIERAIKQKPEVIIIGTGESGVAKVGEDVQNKIQELGINLIIDVTGEAVKVFNVLQEKDKKAIGLFHLTC